MSFEVATDYEKHQERRKYPQGEESGEYSLILGGNEVH